MIDSEKFEQSRLRILALALALAAAPWALAAQASSPAEALLARSIAYHDPGGVWADGAFEFEFRDTRPDGPDRQRRVVIDNAGGRFVLTEQRDDKHVEQTLDTSGCRFEVNGSASYPSEEAEVLGLDCDRLARMRNYYSYLWGMPMKLRDPGTRLDPEVKTDTFDGHAALALRVTYDEAVGSDTWYFYFDPESAALIGYRFYHDEVANDGEYITLAGETELRAGEDLLLRLPRERTWYTHQGDRLLGTDTLVRMTGGGPP
jgi:hypothetical protein